MISKLDFIGVPSTDVERSRAFYVDTLGLRPDPNARYEFWVGETCFGIWGPEEIIGEFKPAMSKTDYLAFARGLFKKERYSAATPA